MEFKSYISEYSERINMINSLFDSKNLLVSYDKLKVNNKVDSELLYFKFENVECSGIFLFGFEFFLSEVSEQEFKKVIGENSLNYKIYNAYHKLKKKQKKIKISDILNQIQDKRKDSGKLNVYLRRILVLAYYLNWNITKDKEDFEGDSFIEIPDQYLIKLKQRFDFNIVTSIYEDENLFMFLNTRGKLNLVFKDLNNFSKEDVEKLIPKVLKKVFNIKKIDFE